MRVFFMLCDFAEVLNGKLYTMGAGWSKFVSTADRSEANISIAGMIYVPWDQSNRKMEINLALFDQDGNLMENQNGKKIEYQGPFEVGRPPGTIRGTELDVPFAFRFEQIRLKGGRYEFRFNVDQEDLYTCPFDVIELSQPVSES